jgi:cell division protein FtsX
VRPQPDLDAFLRLPVATPSSCSEGENGATSGRRSPWVGTVDISVFLDDMSPRALIELQDKVNRIGDVKRVYYESKDQAWAEFQRLYTCSEQVGRDAVPASLRIVLFTMTRTERDDLVRRLQALPGVASVSCDPSTPCTDVQASES